MFRPAATLSPSLIGRPVLAHEGINAQRVVLNSPLLLHFVFLLLVPSQESTHAPTQAYAYIQLDAVWRNLKWPTGQSRSLINCRCVSDALISTTRSLGGGFRIDSQLKGKQRKNLRYGNCFNFCDPNKIGLCSNYNARRGL